MDSPAKAVNAKDPSGLRRLEDRSASDMTGLVDRAIERISSSLSAEPTAKDIEAAVNREASTLSIEAKALISDRLVETYRRSSVRAAQLLRASGIRVEGVLGPASLPMELRNRIEVRALVNADSLSADLKKRAIQSLLSSTSAGEGMRVAKRRLIEATGIDKVSAEKIVRTEIMSAHRDVNDAQFARYGITEERWFAAMDDRTCDECRALHEAAERGETYPVGQRPRVHGGTDINCRCIMLPVIPEVKTNG